MSRGLASRRDLPLIVAAALLPAAVFVGLRAAGRTFYWGDLLYIHFAWRVLPAQYAQAGVLPLWNPYDYLGMPLAAAIQCAAWHPLTLPFHLAGFATALALYHAASYALTAVLWLLALRSWGFDRSAAAAGAAAATLGGVSVSRLPFLNHLGALSMLPALLLFEGSAPLLALALALSFVAGYPPMTVGCAAAAFILSAARRARARGLSSLRGHTGRWAAAAVLAAGLSGVLLLPALGLVRGARRGAGLAPAEALTWSFSPRDLLELTAPPLLPAGEFDPAVRWWKTAYLGLVPLGAAVAGLLRPPLSVSAGAALYAAACILLILGGSNPLSRALWTRAPPLRFVRYPGNMAYLLVPLGALLVARGLHRRRLAPWVLLAALVELFAYAAGAFPTAPAALWTDAGPAVALVRRDADGHRFLLSPRALELERGGGAGEDAAAVDLKQRLYGLSNAPYRLEEVGGFGEPLVPARQYAFMDFLFSRPGAAEAARWMPWADAAALLTPAPTAAPGLRQAGRGLWEASVLSRRPARAYWLPAAMGADLPSGLGEAAPGSRRSVPLTIERHGPTRFSIAGNLPDAGWLYLAEPLGPGWRAAPAEPPLAPALEAFWKRPVAAGPWRVWFRYEPPSFRLGLALTLASLAALALWYHKARSEG